MPMTANLVVLKNVTGIDAAKSATAAGVAYLRKWLDEANAEQLGKLHVVGKQQQT